MNSSKRRFFLVKEKKKKTDLSQKMWNTLKNYIKIYSKVMLNDRYKSNAKNTTNAVQQSGK